ncbi:MAG: hypothetical protein Tsb002_26770 [Wenzhouxiangellaceae bacterium]
MKRLSLNLVAAALIGMVSDGHAQTQTNHPHHDIAKLDRVQGQVMTGTNRLFGQPLWDFGGELGPFGFDFLFAQNPDADEPLPLTASTPDSTVVSNGLNQDFMDAFGLSAFPVDPSVLNLGMREMPMIVNPLGMRAPLPPIQELPPGAVGQAQPNAQITLGDWLDSRGWATLKCFHDGSAEVTLSYRNLIAHGLYTVWLVLGVDTDGSGQSDFISGGPFGGVPNVFVPDIDGRAEYRRTLRYCPQDLENGLIINTVYHADGMVTGASPWMIDFPGGVTTQSVIAFPLNVTPWNQ